ncbi:hypothetical protein [Nostoc sp.]
MPNAQCPMPNAQCPMPNAPLLSNVSQSVLHTNEKLIYNTLLRV